MKTVTILSGVKDGEIDDPVALKIDPDHTVLSIRSASIPSNPHGLIVGTLETYFEMVEVRAECSFNSSGPFLDALIALTGRAIVHPAHASFFVALVRMSAGHASVTVNGYDLPLISVQVEIHPNQLVEASVVFPEPNEPDTWTPDLAVLLLEACGWQLGEASLLG